MQWRSATGQPQHVSCLTEGICVAEQGSSLPVISEKNKKGDNLAYSGGLGEHHLSFTQAAGEFLLETDLVHD